jgi:hypothetical protein
MYWYKRASDHGVARASYDLGTMYNEGIGTRVNQDAAKALFIKSADAGYVPAMMPLALIYAASPDFVSKRRASEYVLKAAEGNDPDGHLTAGYLWDKGDLSFDDSESGRNALTEYRKAADQKNCVAMMNLGGLYFAGRHQIKQNAAQAEQWFGRAEACFGNQFADIRQEAARYRSLAAAGHLPVPEAPPAPLTTSRYFKRPGSSAASNDAQLFSMVGDMLELGALGAAYLIVHPEAAAQAPPLPGDYKSAGDSWEDTQKKLHYEQNLQKLYTGQCKPPIGCI